MIILAFYVGGYLGGVLALWTASRVLQRPLRWSAALLWPIAAGWVLENEKP